MSRLAAKIRSLLTNPEDNLEGLLRALQSREEQPRPRPWSKLPLPPDKETEAVALFPQVIAALAPLVESDDSGQRYGALQALSMIHSTEARAVLLPALADPLSICRVAALEGLSACPPSAAVVDQIIVLLGDEKQAVRLHAASALGLLADERAIAPLQALLDGPGKEARGVKQWAAFSLSEFGEQAGAGGAQADHSEEDADLEEQEAIQREAAERVAQGIGDLLGEFKDKDGITMGDFASGLEAMEQQFERDALEGEQD
jgi:HEAT repeat protein